MFTKITGVAFDEAHSWRVSFSEEMGAVVWLPSVRMGLIPFKKG